MDRRQRWRRSISSINHTHKHIHMWMCVGTHEKRIFSLSEKKINTYRRKIHWLSLTVCVCECVYMYVCVCLFCWLFLVNFSNWRLLCACYKYRKIPLRILAQRRKRRSGNLWWFSTQRTLSLALASIPHLSISLNPLAVSVEHSFSRRDIYNPLFALPATPQTHEKCFMAKHSVVAAAAAPSTQFICLKCCRLLLRRLLLLLPLLRSHTYFIWLFGGKAFSSTACVCSVSQCFRACVCVLVCVSVRVCVCLSAPKRFSTSAVAAAASPRLLLLLLLPVGIDFCSPVT